MRASTSRPIIDHDGPSVSTLRAGRTGSAIGAPVTAGSSASTAIRTPPIRISSPPLQQRVVRRLAVDERPVRGVEVAQPQPVALRRELGVAARRARVADHEVGALDAAEHERAVDLHHAAGVLAGEDLEPHGGPA